MEIFDNRYEQEELLGRGAFSEVWKVKDIQTGVPLALKIYNPTTGVDEDGYEMLTHEFALMVNVSHTNLLPPLFFAISNKRPYLILPYREKGNIGKMIGKMSEDDAWKLIHDCASALGYLHTLKPPILHQDIKPANILMNDNGDYQLTDFGVSTQAKQSMSRVSNQEKELLSAGTISYMAPERFSRNNLPMPANDIWSLGATIYEMLSGDLPFGNDGGLLQKKGAEIPELQGNFSPLLKRTLEKCLEEEPKARPTARRLEDIANNALRYPETRNQIPEVFAAASQEVPQSQIDAAMPPIQARMTVKGAAHIANDLRETVMSHSVTPQPQMKQTVISSNNPYISGNPYTSNGLPSNNSRKGLYIGIAVAAILAIGIGIFFLANNSLGKANSEEVVIDTLEQQRLKDEAEYKAALSQFSQSSPDSIQHACSRMKVLAGKGYKEAVFQVAMTYAWIPNDIESDRRKRLMGWSIAEKGALKGAPIAKEINREAINYLQKAIDMQVPNFHQCCYWLSFYYYYGLATSEDTGKAISLLQQAKSQAEKNQDFVFKEKIEKTLEQLK